MSDKIWRAKWVFPVASEAMADAWVEVVDGVISGLGTGKPPGVAIELGDCALLPALVNAHTHLEFSDLPQPLGSPGMRFPDWIAAVVSARRALAPDLATDAKRVAIELGLQESWRNGVGTVGEIASAPTSANSYRGPVEVTMFHELLGMAPERIEASWQLWRTLSAETNSIELGLSPHAPYTVSLATVREAAERSARDKIPLAMHLAESSEEVEFVTQQTGPFRSLLERFGVWREDAWSGIAGFDPFLTELQKGHRVQVVHGNYLSESQLHLLAARRDRMTLVHCPRTHAYFRHESHPVELAWRLGVRIALGTDSRASNPDLNLWSEARQARAVSPAIPDDCWLRAMTLDAAYSLGREDRAGSLAVGQPFRPCVIELPESAPIEPDFGWLLQTDGCQPRPLSNGGIGRTHLA